MIKINTGPGALSSGSIFRVPSLRSDVPYLGSAQQSDTPAHSQEGVGVSDWNRWYDMYNEQARKAAEEQRLWSAQQAKEQMDFQERMANTAYQRAVQDMREAGLNPALLYSHGGGQAATPAGAMATTSAADVYKNNDPLALLTGLLNLVGTALTSAGNLIGKFIPSTHIRRLG